MYGHLRKDTRSSHIARLGMRLGDGARRVRGRRGCARRQPRVAAVRRRRAATRLRSPKQAVDRAAHAGRPPRPAGQLDQRHDHAARAARRARSLVLTKEEVDELEKESGRIASSASTSQAIRTDRRRPRVATDRPARPGTSAATTISGSTPGDRVAIVNGESRSSLIVDPADGRVPPLTPEARQRSAARLAGDATGRGQYDHPEFRPLAERCIMSFGSNAGPPMLPNYFYNNNYTIVQTKDHVMIMMEMVHDVRDHPDGRRAPVPKHVRPWMGDSIGRWEGDTLVVETTNFHPLQHVPRRVREPEGHRALHARRRGHDPLQVHDRRSDDVHAAVERGGALQTHRRADLRVRVPRGELRAVEHPERRAREGTRDRRRRSSR